MTVSFDTRCTMLCDGCGKGPDDHVPKLERDQKNNPLFKRCSGCMIAIYGHPDCQKAHWREGQKSRCKGVQDLKRCPADERSKKIEVLVDQLHKEAEGSSDEKRANLLAFAKAVEDVWGDRNKKAPVDQLMMQNCSEDIEFAPAQSKQFQDVVNIDERCKDMLRLAPKLAAFINEHQTESAVMVLKAVLFHPTAHYDQCWKSAYQKLCRMNDWLMELHTAINITFTRLPKPD